MSLCHFFGKVFLITVFIKKKKKEKQRTYKSLACLLVLPNAPIEFLITLRPLLKA